MGASCGGGPPRGVSFAILTPGRWDEVASYVEFMGYRQPWYSVRDVDGLLDMTPYGRSEAWEDNPEGRPDGDNPCWYWRADADGNATWSPTSRPVAQWPRPGGGPVDTLGRDAAV
jgi:hypothetical protein